MINGSRAAPLRQMRPKMLLRQKNIQQKDLRRGFFTENFYARVCTQEPLRKLSADFFKVSPIPRYRATSSLPGFSCNSEWYFRKTETKQKNLSSHKFSLYRCLSGVQIREWSGQWSVECKV